MHSSGSDTPREKEYEREDISNLTKAKKLLEKTEKSGHLSVQEEGKRTFLDVATFKMKCGGPL